MDGAYYKWKEFRDTVLSLLPVDKDRDGLGDYIQGQIRQAVIELQSFIMAYRVGHEALYLANDFVTEGRASRAVLPPQAQVQDAFLVHLNSDGKTCRRWALSDFDWGQRMSMVHGQLCENDGQAHMAIDPYGYTFYIFPQVRDCWLVSLFWDGLKLDFQDDEQTPFDEPMALAVSEFVQGKIARKVDNDLALHNSYMISYAQKRKQLYLDAKDRGRIRR